MANYPFKINIETGNGNQYSFYTSSFATDADAVVSSSVIVDRINSIPIGNPYIQSEEAVTEHASKFYSQSNPGTMGIDYLSASFQEPNTGSITFTDTEVSTNGGLKFYTFWGTKVCSVLGLPEGIKIRTENFKLSDNASDSDNYVSGDLISNNIQLKEGFKMSPQARMRSNLIWDDAFGEGFVQWVSGSTRKSFLGYDDTKDVYSLLVSQITSSAINTSNITGTLTGNVTGTLTGNASFATSLNGGGVTLGEGFVIKSKIGNETNDEGHKLILSASLNQLGQGGDIILQGGHNAGGASNGTGLDIRGGHVVVRPGRTNLSVGGAFTEADSSPGTRTSGSFIVSGSSTFTGNIEVANSGSFRHIVASTTNNSQPGSITFTSTDSSIQNGDVFGDILWKTRTDDNAT